MSYVEDFVIEDGILLEYTGESTHVVVPAGVTVIYDYSFVNSSSMESVSIPAGVVKIGKGAFLDCWKLKRVELPDGLRTLGDEAFAACGELGSIVVPDTVISLGDKAFDSSVIITVHDNSVVKEWCKKNSVCYYDQKDPAHFLNYEFNAHFFPKVFHCANSDWDSGCPEIGSIATIGVPYTPHLLENERMLMFHTGELLAFENWIGKPFSGDDITVQKILALLLDEPQEINSCLGLTLFIVDIKDVQLDVEKTDHLKRDKTSFLENYIGSGENLLLQYHDKIKIIKVTDWLGQEWTHSERIQTCEMGFDYLTCCYYDEWCRAYDEDGLRYCNTPLGSHKTRLKELQRVLTNQREALTLDSICWLVTQGKPWLIKYSGEETNLNLIHALKCLRTVRPEANRGLEIAPYAFSECINIREIFIPEVYSIQEYAFANCTNLYTVHFNRVNDYSFAHDAFEGCSKYLRFSMRSAPSQWLIDYCEAHNIGLIYE